MGSLQDLYESSLEKTDEGAAPVESAGPSLADMYEEDTGTALYAPDEVRPVRVRESKEPNILTKMFKGVDEFVSEDLPDYFRPPRTTKGQSFDSVTFETPTGTPTAREVGVEKAQELATDESPGMGSLETLASSPKGATLQTMQGVGGHMQAFDTIDTNLYKVARDARTVIDNPESDFWDKAWALGKVYHPGNLGKWMNLMLMNAQVLEDPEGQPEGISERLKRAGITDEVREYGGLLAGEASQQEQALTKNFNTWDQIVYNAATSTVNYSKDAMIGLGLKSLTGGIVPKNIKSGKGDQMKIIGTREGLKLHHTVPWLFGAEEYGRAFHDGLEKTGDVSKAMRHAEYSMILEGLTEYLPAKHLFKKGTAGYKRLLEVTAREVPGENIAELGQRLSEYINGLEGDVTGEEIIQRFLSEAPEIMGMTTASTLLGSGATVTAVHQAQNLYDAVQKFDYDWRAQRDMKKLINQFGEQQARLLTSIANESKNVEEFMATMQRFADSATREGLTDPTMRKMADLAESWWGSTEERPQYHEDAQVSMIFGSKELLQENPPQPGEVRFIAEDYGKELDSLFESLQRMEANLADMRETGGGRFAVITLRNNIEQTRRKIATTRASLLMAEHTDNVIRPMVQEWLQEFAPHLKLILSDGTHDKRSFGKPYGHMIRLLDENRIAGAFFSKHIEDMDLETDANKDPFASKKNQAVLRDLTETFAHEVGHAIMIDAINNAPAEIRQALIAGYWDHLRKIQAAPSAAAALRDEHGVETGRPKRAKSFYGLRPNESFDEMKERLSRSAQAHPMFDSFFEYMFSYQEYLAHQMERHMSGSKSGVKGLDRYWKKVGTLLKRFHRKSKHSYAPDETFSTYLRMQKARATMERQSKELESLGVAIEEIKDAPTLEGQIEKALNILGKSRAAENEAISIGDPANESTKISGDMDKYGKWIHKYGATLTQLAWDNPHIAGLQEYLKHTQSWWAEKSKWNAIADDTLKAWTNLGSTEADHLANFLLSVTLKSDELQRRLTPQELSELNEEKSHNLSEPAMQLFMQIDHDMQSALGYNPANPQGLYRILIRDANRTYALQPDQKQRQIAKINADMQKLANRNFFPLSRFGKHTVTVRALRDQDIDGKRYKTGDIISFETFESEQEMVDAHARRQTEFAGGRGSVEMDMLLDEEVAVHQMPETLVDVLIHQLGLDEDQANKLKEISLQMSPGQRYKKHLLERKGTKGYSMDAMRGYANYFMHFSNAIARMEYSPLMDEAIRQVGESANLLKGASDSATKRMITKRRRVQQHLMDHKNYIMKPENELASLRAFGFLWYLGAVPKSAWVNLTQIPMVAFPYLAARKELGGGVGKGDALAMASLTKAMADVSRVFATGKGYNNLEMEMMEELRRRGVIDESLATELAGIAEGSTLSRLLPGGHKRSRTAVKGLRMINNVGTFLFHSAEKANRRVTALAAYRMARKQGMDHTAATEEAHRAVDKTQYEYARWNRARFMRGQKSVIFLFMQYIQQTLHFLIRDPGSFRALMVLVALGGLQALPFAEDIEDILNKLVNLYKKKFGASGERFDLFEEVRAVANLINAEPDMVMRGVGHEYGMGPLHIADFMGLQTPNTDISASISLGRVTPGLEESLQGSEVTNGLVKGIAAAGGPVVAIPVTIWDAVASNDPDVWKRVERALPSVLKNISKGTRWAVRGEETNRSGARIARFDLKSPEHISEIVAQMAGFTPARVSKKREFDFAQKEMEDFYNSRKAVLMEEYGKAVIHGNPNEIAEIQKQINRFNTTLPYPELAIGKSVGNSINQRMKNIYMRDLGYNPKEQFFRSQLDRAELYGGTTTEEPTR
jgi:hypothetical protein